MKLKLTRPMVFFDLETTGVNITKDRIVEISVIKVMPDGSTETKTIIEEPRRRLLLSVKAAEIVLRIILVIVCRIIFELQEQSL